MMTQAEQSSIKQILQSKSWPAAERLANLVCEQIQAESVERETEFETLKAVFKQSGQVAGIRRFMQEMYHNAS